MARSSLPLTALIALMLAGCAVGPDYQVPQTTDAPDRFNEVRNPDPFDAQAERRFWQGFDDPMLADLIRQSLSANYNLQVAVARYERAQALLRGAERNQLPSVTASGSVSENHLAEVERTGSADDVTLYQVGAVAHWELDLFGRLRRITEAQSAELDAAGADLNAVQVALVGQLASSYFELRGITSSRHWISFPLDWKPDAEPILIPCAPRPSLKRCARRFLRWRPAYAPECTGLQC